MPRGPSNYVPRPDGDFSAWLQNYHAQLTIWWQNQGYDPTDLKDLDMAVLAWDAAYPAHVAAQAQAASAAEAKADARAAVENALRPLTRFVQSDPKTTDADRATIGITVRKTTRTPSATPTTRPRVSLAGVNRLTHDLLVVDDATPTTRGRPKGAQGAEVWLTLVDPGAPTPIDPALLRYLTTTQRSSVRATFAPHEGGKTAVYMTRWVSTRGDKGPWSEPIAATVAA